MVTILETGEAILTAETAAAETATAPAPLPAGPAPAPVWGYTVPCAGVRYYTCRAAAKGQASPPPFLPVKLLDERVFPL